MKFAHIADVHLGAKPDADKPWGKFRDKEIYDTFTAFIDCLEMEPVDFLFITGDLFDHVPTEEEIYAVDKILFKLKNTNIIYITGEADYLKKDAPLWSYAFMSNVYLLNGDEFNRANKSVALEGERPSYADKIIDCVHFEKFNLDIYGICQFSSENQRNDFDTITIHNQNNINILLVHAGGEKVEPFAWEEVYRLKNFDYVGMGHIHNYQEKPEYKTYYPGSLEPLSIDEQGAHGYIKGYVDKQIMSAKLVPFSHREYTELNFDVDENTVNSKLVSRIVLNCEENSDNIYKINIRRSKKCYEDFDLSEVEKKYKVLEVNGAKGLSVNSNLLMLHNNDNILGQHIRRLNDSSNPYKKDAVEIYSSNMVVALWGVDNLELTMMAADEGAAKYAHRSVISNIKNEIEYLQSQIDKNVEKKEDYRQKSEKYKDMTGEINSTNEKINAINLKIDDVSFRDSQINRIFDLKRLKMVLLFVVPVFVALAIYVMITVAPAYLNQVFKPWLIRVLIVLLMDVVLGYLVYKIYTGTQSHKKVEEHSDNQNKIYEYEKDREKLIYKLSEYEINNEKHKYFLDEIKNLDKKTEEMDRNIKIYKLITDTEGV
ncbi:MAG: metallophosphoesterase [Lachnospiraceae bacterium]|nr:metallophosphoesterase [Lachnospiraceae bacterium]